MRFAERVAVVTGAGGGLGAAYARALAREGAAVIAADIDGAAAERSADAISEDGGRCSAYPVDLTDPVQVERLAADCIEANGRLDILVNNAGGELPGGTSVIAEVDPDHWDGVMAINLKTAFLCCRAVAEPMKRQRYGKIVNVSSRSARSTGWFSQVTPEYVCAKSGVIALTRHVAKELGPYGVNVNCLVPSFTISGPKLRAAWDAMTEAERTAMLAQTPLRRLPEPEELANVVAFLCSNESSYITGAAIDVNGGSFMA